MERTRERTRLAALTLAAATFAAAWFGPAAQAATPERFMTPAEADDSGGGQQPIPVDDPFDVLTPPGDDPSREDATDDPERSDAAPTELEPASHDGGTNPSAGSLDDPFDPLSLIVADHSNEDGTDDPQGSDPDELETH